MVERTPPVPPADMLDTLPDDQSVRKPPLPEMGAALNPPENHPKPVSDIPPDVMKSAHDIMAEHRRKKSEAALAQQQEQTRDNWRHRAQGIKCSTCTWFSHKGTGPLGRCRKSAPTLEGWPVMYVTDWCGDHKLDETKL